MLKSSNAYVCANASSSIFLKREVMSTLEFRNRMSTAVVSNNGGLVDNGSGPREEIGQEIWFYMDELGFGFDGMDIFDET